MSVELLAFAKINLALRVLRRREDGFHEIDSIIQTVDLADRITVEADVGLHVENDLTEIDGEDLVARAARAILQEKGRGGVRIRVRKGIPAGAGLGGGSSDAAAVISAIDRLFPPRLASDDLLAVAARLGSDVPLFLRGGFLRMRGRGELLSPAGLPRPEWFLLLVPPIRCQTSLVYRGWSPGAPLSQMSGLDFGVNDLLAPALSIYPELIPYHRAVMRLDCLYAGMSGSGSAFYAAFPDRRAAAEAVEGVKEDLPEASLFICSPTTEGHRIIRGGIG